MTHRGERQLARKSARDRPSVQYQQRRQRQLMIEGLAVEVLVALGERDRAVATCERSAGAAIKDLVTAGVSLHAIATVLSDKLTIREIKRLRALGMSESESEEQTRRRCPRG